MAVDLGVNQLDRDPDPLADLAHAAFDDVVHAQFARELQHFDRLALVLERRIARDDEQIAKAEQLGDDVFGDAVGEELLLGVAAQVEERQDRDLRLVGALARGRRRSRRRDQSCRVVDLYVRTGWAMFLTCCSPRSSKVAPMRLRIAHCTASDTITPPGSASDSRGRAGGTRGRSRIVAARLVGRAAPC